MLRMPPNPQHATTRAHRSASVGMLLSPKEPACSQADWQECVGAGPRPISPQLGACPPAGYGAGTRSHKPPCLVSRAMNTGLSIGLTLDRSKEPPGPYRF